MIEAAAPAGTITHAFSWLPPKRGQRGSSEPPPTLSLTSALAHATSALRFARTRSVAATSFEASLPLSRTARRHGGSIAAAPTSASASPGTETGAVGLSPDRRQTTSQPQRGDSPFEAAACSRPASTGGARLANGRAFGRSRVETCLRPRAGIFLADPLLWLRLSECGRAPRSSELQLAAASDVARRSRWRWVLISGAELWSGPLCRRVGIEPRSASEAERFAPARSW